MIVLQREKMPNGTTIQIEDWTEDYKNHWNVGAYPIAKEGDKYGWIKRKQTFRLTLNFDSKKQAEQAFSELLSGEKELIDYKNCFYNGSEDIYYLTGGDK